MVKRNRLNTVQNEITTHLIQCMVLFLLASSFTKAQEHNIKWYSESTTQGIRIQNSFPKGGPYKGTVKAHFNHSYLVFFTRITNASEQTIELNLNFPGDAVSIPNAPETYMQIMLPSEIMTLDKVFQFSYGLTDLSCINHSTQFSRTLAPKESCLFYVVAFFYQTNPDPINDYRGGNRAAFVLKDENFIFNMLPQIDEMSCGQILFK